MSTISAFKIDDVVYLRTSAQIGFLESYKVTGIYQVRNGVFTYTININERPPSAQTVGDRIILKQPTTLYFNEDELLSYCEAQQIVVDHLRRRLASEEARLQARCPSGSGGSGST
jgi:hypothetical protein